MKKKNILRRCYDAIPSGIICLLVVFALFGYLGHKMGTPNMLNTVMNTAHDLLLNTVFYLWPSVCSRVRWAKYSWSLAW